MKNRVLAVLAFSFIALVTASAGTIGPVCGSCQGGVYTLTYNVVNTAGVNDIYDIFLTINTATYNGGGLFIDAVAPRVTNTLISATLLTSPAGDTWTPNIDQGIDSNGCSGGGGGFLCTISTGSGAPVSNITNSWSWRVTIGDGTLFTGLNQAHIKVRYTDGQGSKVGGLVSEDITLTAGDGDGGGGDEVPEPASIGLIGLGLVGLAAATRRFRQ